MGHWMLSAVGACPRGRHRVRRRAIAVVRVALLVVLALVAAAHAVVLRLRGGTVDRAITVGRAVDTVLMDGVYITNGVAVVFDVAAMLPGALRIELRNCVCDGGARAYVAIVLLLLTTVLLAVTVYSVVLWYAEDRHWQELREPRRGGLEALLRDDEETQKPHDMTSSSYASGTTGASSYRPPAQQELMAGDTRSDALSLFDRASSASCSVNCAPLDR
ncbi:putative dispersed gene family protein 1 (DGF-1) [Trypanosoma cruzi]|nr:putative dispersed gene family protein 1 (DGF-1) [Trypanosoma cruzi]